MTSSPEPITPTSRTLRYDPTGTPYVPSVPRPIQPARGEKTTTGVSVVRRAA